MAFSVPASGSQASKPFHRAVKSLGRPGNDQALRRLSQATISLFEQKRRAEEDVCEEEEDRLSTAAPSSVSPCEVTRIRWADMEDSDHDANTADLGSAQPSRARWSDLVDDSDKSSVEVVAQKHPDGMEGSNFARERQHWHDRPQDSWKHQASRANKLQNHFQLPRDQKQQLCRNKTKEPYQYIDSTARKDSSHHQASSDSARISTCVSGAKLQCQFLIGIEEEPTFRVCRKLLGPQGQFMKEIAVQTGSKLRLRGRGSKFLEGPEQEESADPLMLCISSPNLHSYAETKKLVSNLLESVYDQFRAFSEAKGSAVPNLCIKMHEGPRAGSF